MADLSEHSGPPPSQMPNKSGFYERGHYRDKAILCSGGYDHSIRFWNTEAGYCERIIQHSDNQHQINAMAITPNREILASAGYQHIRLYDIDSGNSNPLINFEGVTKNITCVGFNSIGTWLYTGGEDGYIRIWDVRCRALHCQRKREFQTPINSIFLHPNGVEIYVADQSGSIYIWNLQSDDIQRIFVTNEGFVNSICYDNDSKMLAALDTRGNCFIFRSTPFVPRQTSTDANLTGEVTKSGFLQRKLMFQAHSKHGLKCIFSPDSTVLATASADTTVKFWNTSKMSIENPTMIVSFDDPYENITDCPTGPACTAGVFGPSRQPVFKKAYSEDENHLVGGSYVDFLRSPFLASLFSAGTQPPRPPPCYMKPKRSQKRCPVCNGIKDPCDYSKSNSTPALLPTGRSTYHSPGCTGQSIPSYLPHLTSVIPLQPNMNSFSQLTFNLNPHSTKASNSGVTTINPCNHFSHFPSHGYRGSLRLDSKGSEEGSSYSSSSSSLREPVHLHGKQGPHHQHHSHHHRQQHYGTQAHLPSYYNRYFDNKYYELHSKSDDQSANSSSAAAEEAEEDQEFFQLMKKMNLIDAKVVEGLNEVDEEANTDNDEIDEVDEDEVDDDDECDEGGLEKDKYNLINRAKTSRVTFQVRKKTRRARKPSKNAEYCCCTCCEICGDGKEALEMIDSPDSGVPPSCCSLEDRRVRRPSGNPKADVQLVSGQLGKNEWPYAPNVIPSMVMSHNTQKWIWDMAFSADSQYIFTASSDQTVRLWRCFTGEIHREFHGHQKAVTALAFADLLKPNNSDQPVEPSSFTNLVNQFDWDD